MKSTIQYEDTINHVHNIVEKACRQESNIFGYGIWENHIVSVVYYGKQLAQQLDADSEIVHLAALLHDYAGIKNEQWIADHHIHGAELAGEILQDLAYPADRTRAIEHCILSHRGSKSILRETVEAEILASADAMAHFAQVPSLLYLAYMKKEMAIETGSQWVLDKLERSWNKLMPEAKRVLQERYDAIKLVLSNTS